MTYAGMGAGMLLSRAAVPPILAGTIDMSALALMCILVLVVLVVLVLPEGVLAKVGAAARSANKEEDATETEADTLKRPGTHRCPAPVFCGDRRNPARGPFEARYSMTPQMRSAATRPVVAARPRLMPGSIIWCSRPPNQPPWQLPTA